MPLFLQLCPYQKLKKKNSVTLQVRMTPSRWQDCRTRVLSSAFQTVSASMTLEAALVFPLFLFAGLLMLMPLTILDQERQVQAVLETVTEQICQMPKAEELGESVWYGIVMAELTGKLDNERIRNLSLKKSTFFTPEDEIDLIAEYEIVLLFPVLRIETVKRQNRSFRRIWTGKTGIRSENGLEEELDEWVYVGKGSTRYHVSRTCRYLEHQLFPVLMDELEGYRTEDGSRYRSCARCGKYSEGVVYLMKGGEHYHSTVSCTAIQSYVRTVRKSEVAHLGPCSVCSGGGSK